MLGAGLTKRVLLDEGGLDPTVIQELARESGGKRLPCPTCAQAMAPVTLKGTAVDICFPCGVTFLDEGELERLSGGRHQEEAPPPMRVRPVDQLAAVEESEAAVDPRATWEKAAPLYVAEAWVVWAVLLARDVVAGPLTAVGVSLGIIALPLGFSMLADVDLRALFHRRRGWHLTGAHHHGVSGLFLFVAAVFVGGVISTVNAIIAERFPRAFSTRHALIALGLLIVVGVVMSAI